MSEFYSLIVVLLTVYSVAGNSHLEKGSDVAQRQMAQQALPMLQSLCNVFGNCNQLSSLSALTPSASSASYYSSGYSTTPAPYSAPSAYVTTTTTPALYAAPSAPSAYMAAPSALSSYMAAPSAPSYIAAPASYSIDFAYVQYLD